MNKENKYYKPSIEELHIGLEFECILPQWDIQDWQSATIGTDTYLDGLEEVIKLNKCRVKYLDREDIESLGWIKVKEGWNDFWNDFYKEFPWGVITIRAKKYFENRLALIIKCRSLNNDNRIIFEGRVKNKSELKTLLRQLKIQKEDE